MHLTFKNFFLPVLREVFRSVAQTSICLVSTGAIDKHHHSTSQNCYSLSYFILQLIHSLSMCLYTFECNSLVR